MTKPFFIGFSEIELLRIYCMNSALIYPLIWLQAQPFSALTQ
ncbi:hypothetical protein VCSRO113_2643 [Vibrio cholerae]|nr:hypothetical protein SAMEA4374365_02749 [Vibrio cholerae]GHW15174.1 hypothetical protein VCSRO192_2975 [Vibrio cholerae]GHX26686.1 hypothetical protein VCSRO107_2683 [Vibrio cholerae]GHX39277.1 hypothetical protein VCSRO62_3006 [Vibrio cholerae]GHX97862.1 hypothetical protein VCSRO210_2569 [Vibrio cholerae]